MAITQQQGLELARASYPGNWKAIQDLLIALANGDFLGPLDSTEVAALNGITPGTVTASKALVVDANKDLATLRHLTISGNLVTGTTTLSEAELGVVDGVTAGTVTASKALVVDANKGIGAFRITGQVVPFTQGAANALNSTGTQTAAMMLGGIITSTTAAGVTATLDTGTALDTAYLALFPGGAANDYIEWSVVNTGGNSYTQATAAGWTDGGNLFVAVATATSARFGARRTGANAWTGWKIG
jgi:hypothetical protein